MSNATRAGAVVFAKDLRRVATFYEALLGLPAVHAEPDHIVLGAALGGELNPPTGEWQARGFRACDGHDPEGNVFQLREDAR